MSHSPGQPLEVPSREVHHDLPEDEYLYGVEHIIGFGHVRDEVWHGWESEKARKQFWDDRRRADEARARLGGFGFRGVV